MDYVLTTNDLTVSFTDKDKIDVIAFSGNILNTWSTSDGLSKGSILWKIKEQDLGGSTALYKASNKALDILSKENDEYISSIVLMTDGMNNVGTYKSFENYYKNINKEIPIYSITFGDADPEELLDISNLTNGKVFDGKTNLTLAFKKVRGYN
jgi:Ca-activated chloride channel family protein